MNMRIPESESRSSWRLDSVVPACAAAFAGGLVAIAGGHWLGDGQLDQWLLSTRYTARWSFALFVVAYTAPSLAKCREARVATLFLRYRCAMALCFATAHVVHFACIAVYFAIRREVPATAALVVGGTGYALLLAMLVTGWSWVATNGTRWRRLHAVAPHYLWFVALLTYASRVSERGVSWLPYLIVTVAALAVRLSPGRCIAAWATAVGTR
jgi:hypothetical protein